MQQQTAPGNWLSKGWSYAKSQYWELPANVLEGITLVLLVFVQDVAFKQSVVVCAALLFISLGLHGLAHRAGQNQIWPKVIEIAAPWPFVAMIPAGFLSPVYTQKTAFITINVWFAAVQVACILAGRNFMMEYMQDWNPKEVWGTPLLRRCANATAAVWIVAELTMALAQALAFGFNLSVDNGSNVGAAVFVCYVMQLLPLLVAIVFTFAYPTWLKKRWGYAEGVRDTCYPPLGGGAIGRKAEGTGSAAGEAAVDMTAAARGAVCNSSGNSQQSLTGSCSSGGSEDVMVCISPTAASKPSC